MTQDGRIYGVVIMESSIKLANSDTFYSRNQFYSKVRLDVFGSYILAPNVLDIFGSPAQNPPSLTTFRHPTEALINTTRSVFENFSSNSSDLMMPGATRGANDS